MVRLDTNPAARFFSPAQADAIKARYGNACAACGCRDTAIIECDHWVAFNGINTVVANGVALCGPCNRKKSNTRMAGKPIAPRAPVDAITVNEYLLQVEANRNAFNQWVSLYKGSNRVKRVAFKPPY